MLMARIKNNFLCNSFYVIRRINKFTDPYIDAYTVETASAAKSYAVRFQWRDLGTKELMIDRMVINGTIQATVPFTT